MGGQTKIGARSLSDNEIKLILPTYGKIEDQIIEIRNSSADADTDMQKTNNIGIMGKRGAGKTSVLKTIAKNLKKEKNIEENGDIVLDLIIPENMSEASTLMATILGLFKSNVDEIVRKEDKRTNGCGVNKENDLKRAYDEAIKQYAYIQKDYRDILIQEFSSEPEYLKKTTQVFNSDIEFIKKLNTVIGLLIKKRKNEVKGNPLIVVFIDDIDLSTRRCSDVVKTLLSYLSSPYILTFISGDLDTFEEALTLEFLRQEGFITSDAMRQEFLNEKNGCLLDRKKIQAYEYLKKVVPPVYRHNIKLWSLEQRGKFNISIDGKNEGSSLRELLKKALDRCENHNTDGKSRLFDVVMYPDIVNEEKVNKTLMPLYSYHLFDNTSRGLNNVYNVLLQIDEDQELDFSTRKILIETIVSSNPIYNKNRVELFENVILFGNTQAGTTIRWDNLIQLIYSNKENQIIKSPVERFSLFLLVYFSANLLELEYNNNFSFEFAKISTINTLIKNPIISENLLMIDEPFDLMKEYLDYWGYMQEGETHINRVDNKGKQKKSTVINYSFDLIINFLIKSNFEFSLNFYQILSQRSFDFLELADYDYKNKKNRLTTNVTSAIRNKNILSVYQAFCSYSDINIDKNNIAKYDISKYIVGLYDGFGLEFAYLQNNIYRDKALFTIDELLSEHIYSLGDVKYRLLLNTIKQEIIKFFTGQGFNREFNSSEFLNYLDPSEEKRASIIKSIDSKNLWDHTMADSIKAYINKNISVNMIRICNSLDNEEPKSFVDITNFFSNSWQDFKKIYTGATYTKAINTKFNINHILNKVNKTVEGKSELDYYNFTYYNAPKHGIGLLEIISNLAHNNRVRYGQAEAQQMFKDLLYNSTIIIDEKNKEKIEEKNKLILNIYYLCMWKYNKNISVNAEMLVNFVKEIEQCQLEVNDVMKKDFLNNVTVFGDKINMDEFIELFK
ncbi:hypothetical protein [Anaerotignum propionicum]|uniref:AAA+ ATPase domain-containing protein n=1 Tax=Anaerotignum propionicum DSM 1682 TaxID=991789 RepID=A0A0X8VBK1_ANAPI|nr:hypothetical protein [Anaerotignum propionicum]AMJ39765.1 hypothetical protein CPRO_01410 [Anaerotignum propionicum DSM 1682]SHE28862.1 hypothetical protein SAMN02745151_00212 [[Clostridium] propionicum DSM 1682] [Anaerotignum propionicum DSM 1682]